MMPGYRLAPIEPDLPAVEVMIMLKFNVVLLTLVSLLLPAVCSCNLSAMSRPAPIPAPKKFEGWLIERKLVESTDLRIVWQFNLPLSDSETLDRIFVCGNRLSGLSGRNFLSCLNRAEGNVIFNSQVAPDGLPVADIKCFKDEFITVVGDNLLEISADSGAQKTSTRIAYSASCPVVRNDSFFYIAGIDKRLHVLNAGNKVPAFDVAAESDALITSVLADQEFAVFATEAGNVICINSGKSVKFWQFDAPAAIVPSIVRDANSLYFACRDTNIYRLDLSSGELLWKYQTSAILDIAPQVGARVLYQYIPEVGLIALDKVTGKQIWQLPNGAGLLAESGDKAFIVTKAGLVVAMDNTRAKQLYSVDIGMPVKFAANAIDSKIYIADANGRLACLEPVR